MVYIRNHNILLPFFFLYQLVDKYIFTYSIHQNVLQNKVIWFLDLPSQSSPVLYEFKLFKKFI